jgi:hypothetical protein
MAAIEPYELAETISALLAGKLAPDKVRCLEQYLAEDTAAYNFYLDAIALDIDLEWSYLNRKKKQNLPASSAFVVTRESPAVSEQSGPPAQAKSFVLPGNLMATRDRLLLRASLQYVALVAICVYGTFLLVAWNLRPDALPPIDGQDAVAVVCDATDVKWSPNLSSKTTESPVLTGESLKIESGTIELELKTGTKLVVKGPADWSVNGRNSVSLRSGTLMARVPADAIGFTVETPTAKIVDLGTEFSVEVDRDGVTESRVFRGAIKVQPVATSEGQVNEERAVVVRENESIRIDKALAADNRQALTIRKETESEPFVRSLPSPEKPLPMIVVAHFRMGEDDPSAVAGEAVVQQTIGQKRSHHLKQYGSPTYTSNAAPGSSLAMSFTGAADEYLFEPGLHIDYVEEFILEAWVRPNRPTNDYTLVVFNGRGFSDGYGIGIHSNLWALPCGGPVGWKVSQIACELGKWTHVALVCERGKLQIWINGRLAKDFGVQAMPMPSGAFSIGGAPESVAKIPNGFDGQIDEIRLSKFRPPFDPRMLLFRQSSKDTK